MKAKDYAANWQNSKHAFDAEKAVDLGMIILKDIEDIADTRKAHFDTAFIAIFKEVYNKFLKARQLCPQMDRDIFHLAIKSCWPDLYLILIKDKVIPDILVYFSDPPKEHKNFPELTAGQNTIIQEARNNGYAEFFPAIPDTKSAAEKTLAGAQRYIVENLPLNR